jgi:hypothetical protein
VELFWQLDIFLVFILVRQNKLAFLQKKAYTFSALVYLVHSHAELFIQITSEVFICVMPIYKVALKPIGPIAPNVPRV